MENASKALLIAGEILIAMLILALGVAIFTSYRGTAESYEEQMSAKEIGAFNNKFLRYIEYDNTGNKRITAQNLITIANLAKEVSSQGITIQIRCNGKTNEDLAKYILENNTPNNMFENDGAVIYYNMLGDIDYNNGRITNIKCD